MAFNFATDMMDPFEHFFGDMFSRIFSTIVYRYIVY